MAQSSTPATAALSRAGVAYTAHLYEMDGLPGATTYGEAVAEALGVAPERLFKTLVAEVDGGVRDRHRARERRRSTSRPSRPPPAASARAWPGRPTPSA